MLIAFSSLMDILCFSLSIGTLTTQPGALIDSLISPPDLHQHQHFLRTQLCNSIISLFLLLLNLLFVSLLLFIIFHLDAFQLSAFRTTTGKVSFSILRAGGNQFSIFHCSSATLNGLRLDFFHNLFCHFLLLLQLHAFHSLRFFCAPEKLLICVYFRNFASFVSAGKVLLFSHRALINFTLNQQCLQALLVFPYNPPRS